MSTIGDKAPLSKPLIRTSVETASVVAKALPERATEEAGRLEDASFGHSESSFFNPKEREAMRKRALAFAERSTFAPAKKNER